MFVGIVPLGHLEKQQCLLFRENGDQTHWNTLFHQWLFIFSPLSLSVVLSRNYMHVMQLQILLKN